MLGMGDGARERVLSKRVRASTEKNCDILDTGFSETLVPRAFEFPKFTKNQKPLNSNVTMANFLHDPVT